MPLKISVIMQSESCSSNLRDYFIKLTDMYVVEIISKIIITKDASLILKKKLSIFNLTKMLKNHIFKTKF